MGEEPLLLQRSCRQAGWQRGSAGRGDTLAPAPGWGIAAVLRARRASSQQGEVLHTGLGRELSEVPAAKWEASGMGHEGPKISEESRAA